jgi:copper chaperone CopZ
MITTTHTLSGMTCSHCAGSVTTAVGKIAGITDVAVDVSAGTVTITSEAELPAGVVAAAVEEAGYELVQSCCSTGTGANCSGSSAANAR